jgi:hypothetical protein
MRNPPTGTKAASRRISHWEHSGTASIRKGLWTTLLLAAAGAGAPGFADAGEGAAFLKLATGARPAAMGGAHTALASDVNAIAWNPAGLSEVGKMQLGATHAELPAGARHDFLAAAGTARWGHWGCDGSSRTR